MSAESSSGETPGWSASRKRTAECGEWSGERGVSTSSPALTLLLCPSAQSVTGTIEMWRSANAARTRSPPAPNVTATSSKSGQRNA